jgi:hypothetical protein
MSSKNFLRYKQMALTYKAKFRLALVACAMLMFLILVIFLIGRATSPPSSSVIVVREDPIRVQAKAHTWEYKPSENPRYENNRSIQQIGFMTSTEATTPNGDPKILPLFGQSLRDKHSDRWAYFTATDQQQSIRLPVEFESRDCMNDDVGCRELFTADTVKVPSYNDQEFKISLYKNKLPHV